MTMANGPLRIIDRLNELTYGAQTLLDVGSGPGTYTLHMWRVPIRLAVDASKESLDKITDPSIMKLWAFAQDALKFMSHIKWCRPLFDVAIALDFIEHLAKVDALQVIELMKQVARKVVIFTPAGFMSQSIPGQPYQTHLSGWTAQELKDLGFAVEEWVDFDYGIPSPGGGLWAVWDRP